MRSAVFDARRGWSVLGLAVLVPLVITGLVLAGVYIAASWGREPVSTPDNTLSTGFTVVLVLLIRYVVLAAWWGWFSLATGRPWTRGLAAALPVIGLYWSLLLVAPLVRGEVRMSPVRRGWVPVAALVVVLAFLSLPLAMTITTTSDQREEIRLAQPCELERDLSQGAPVLTVGDRTVGEDALAGLVADRALFESAAGTANSPLLPVTVANATLPELLLAQRAYERPTVGQVEAVAGEQADADMLRAWCLDGAQRQLLSDRGVEGVAAALVALPVTVDPALGYWDPQTATVTRTPPREQRAEEQTATESEAATTLRTRVNYGSESLEDTETDGLAWTADLCLTSPSLLQATYRDRIRLFTRTNGAWVPVPGTKVVSERGGRCGDDGINVLVTGKATDPGPAWVGKGWTTCRNHKIVIPETPQFAPTDVPMCVSVEATAKEGSDA